MCQKHLSKYSQGIYKLWKNIFNTFFKNITLATRGCCSTPSTPTSGGHVPELPELSLRQETAPWWQKLQIVNVLISNEH